MSEEPKSDAAIAAEPKSPKLTVRQKRFVRALAAPAVNGNAAEAARIAGYSAHTAKQIAAENLSKPYLTRELELLRLRLEERVEVSPEWSLNTARHMLEMELSSGNVPGAHAVLKTIMAAQGLLEQRGPGRPSSHPGVGAKVIDAKVIGLVNRISTPPTRE